MKHSILVLCCMLACSAECAEPKKANPEIYNTSPSSPPSGQRPQVVPAAKLQSKKGLTFGVRKTLPRNNTYHQSAITTVGCKDASGAACDAYQGDTDCNVSLPVLCFAPLTNQQDPSQGALHQWVSGRINVVGPVPGNSFKTLKDVDLACSRLGNPNWRAARFHEHPKGWNWTAFGKAPNNRRFWVHIDDQPATCWAK